MKGFCYHFGGGLGDVLRLWLCGDEGYPWCQPFWGSLQQWNQDTGMGVRIINASHNPSAADFFKYVPWVHEIITVPWNPTCEGELPVKYAGDGYIPLSIELRHELETKYPWQCPDVWLSPEEKEEADLILSQGDYVLIYPFGGYGPRVSPYSYISLIDMLIGKGMKVVVVGDSHIRCGSDVNENFNYDTDGLFNLVNRNNCRLTSYLATRAKVYIGSIGCYLHPATAFRVKLFALTCYEIWENHQVYGASILGNDSLWYLRRYTGTFENFADTICLYSEEKLDHLWTKIVNRIFSNNPSGFWYWGDSNKRRDPKWNFLDTEEDKKWYSGKDK